MKVQHHYASASQAIEDLRQKGYQYDYNLNEKEILMDPDDYIVHHIYRYEGDSNPDDESIVYGISSFDDKKGFYVSGYSANSNAEVYKVIQHIIAKGINFSK